MLVSVRAWEEVWLGHQVILRVHHFPHVIPLLQKHPIKAAVHWIAGAHVFVVLQDGGRKPTRNEEGMTRLEPGWHRYLLLLRAGKDLNSEMLLKQ